MQGMTGFYFVNIKEDVITWEEKPVFLDPYGLSASEKPV